MSKTLWGLVADKLLEHNYMEGIERTVERVKKSAEIFTPNDLVLEIVQYLDLDLFAPGKNVLDPACGDGQFLVAAKWIKVFHFQMSEESALNEIYGVDIMLDNVQLCRRRLRGGTIAHGNSLRPYDRLTDQSERDHRLMLDLFAEEFSRVSKNYQTKRVARMHQPSTLF